MGLAVMIGAVAQAAHAADDYMYVVNATGKPLAISIDGQPSPEVAHLMAATRRTSPGKHVLSATGASGSESISVELRTEGAHRDEQQRGFWCFVVGQPPEGPPKVIVADLPTCGQLIQRGVNGRPLR